jgi:hypothetical protein
MVVAKQDMANISRGIYSGGRRLLGAPCLLPKVLREKKLELIIPRILCV